MKFGVVFFSGKCSNFALTKLSTTAAIQTNLSGSVI